MWKSANPLTCKSFGAIRAYTKPLCLQIWADVHGAVWASGFVAKAVCYQHGCWVIKALPGKPVFTRRIRIQLCPLALHWILLSVMPHSRHDLSRTPGVTLLDLLLDAAGARHHSPADWRCWQAGCRLPSCRVSSSKRKGGADCGCVDLVTYSRSKEPRAFFKRGVLHCVEAQPKQPSRRTTPRNEAWFR